MKHKRLPRWTPAAILVIAGSTQSLATGPFGAVLELSSLDGTNGFVLNGIDTSDRSGRSVSGAGDVNGDGIDDLIIGAFNADPNGESGAGETYVVFGGAGVGAGGVVELSSLTGANGFVVNGIDAYDRCGGAVSGAGDVNGDGIDDLLIGAYFADPNGELQAGETYVVFGGAGVGAGGIVELSSLTGANGFVVNGIDFDVWSGHSVSGAGDVNGDGIDDLIIGAPAGTYYTGKTYVVFGGAGVGADGVVELSSLTGANGFVVNSIDADDHCGGSVSGAGDINCDGIDDILIGAFDADPNGEDRAGETYVVFGSAGIGAGGAVELSSLTGANGFVLNGIDERDASGASVSGAGDVNGDGIDDLLIGALRADPNGVPQAGETYVVFGGAGVGAGGAIELSLLNGANGFVVNGIDAGDRCGRSVSGAGDINGDGIDDLLIGADDADQNGELRAGETYVVFGGANIGASGALELSQLNGTNGFVLNGIAGRDSSGGSVASAGDVNGDGIDDLIIGAPGAEPGGKTYAGASYVVFGRCAPPADINADKIVDSADLGILLGQFNTPGPGADINGDGVVDTADLGLLLGAFNTSCP